MESRHHLLDIHQQFFYQEQLRMINFWVRKFYILDYLRLTQTTIFQNKKKINLVRNSRLANPALKTITTKRLLRNIAKRFKSSTEPIFRIGWFFYTRFFYSVSYHFKAKIEKCYQLIYKRLRDSSEKFLSLSQKDNK